MPRPLLTVRVDFSAVLAAKRGDQKDADAAFAEAVRALAPLDVLLTRDVWAAAPLPGQCGAVNVIPTACVPWEPEAVGWSQQLWFHTDLYGRCESFVCWFPGNPVKTGRGIAHEIMHVVGPAGAPHTTGLFDPTASGADIAAADVPVWNASVAALATGQRIGFVDDGSNGGRYRRDVYDVSRVDPNWQLPVFGAGLLIFAAGPCPPVFSMPAGWTVADAAAVGGALVLDFNRRIVFHPGQPGEPVTDPNGFATFAGLTPEPVWGPAPGWKVRRGTGPQTGGRTAVFPGPGLVYLP